MTVKLVKIVKQGSVTVEAFENVNVVPFKKLCGVGGGSTVVYIKSDANILVDTGFDYETDLSRDNVERNAKMLEKSLESAGLKVSDIDIVFITHWHLDHVGNIGMFMDSEIATSKIAAENVDIDVVGVRDGKRLADGVKVVYTPGHTKDHASLIVETERMLYKESSKFSKGYGGKFIGVRGAKIAVAGDAIVSLSYFLLNKVWKYNADFYSEKEAVSSVNKLSDVDYIIPGHGGIFTPFRLG